MKRGSSLSLSWPAIGADEHHQARDEHGLADHQRVVTAHLGQIHRVQIGQAVKPDTQHEGEQAADGKIAIGESAQIDNRHAGRQHTGEEKDRREPRNHGHGEDRVVVEPFITRALLEHIFERAEKAGHAEQAVPVEILQQREIRLVEIDEQISRDGDDDARSDIDEEQPMPRISVGQIAADRWTDGRRQCRDQTDHRGNELLPRALEDQIGRGKHRRHHAAADETLQRAPHDHAADRGARAAHDAGKRETARRYREQDPRADGARQKSRQRDGDDLGDQVGRLHPGNFIRRRRQAGLYLGQRRRHDLDVEERHEHAEAHGEKSEQPARRDRLERRARLLLGLGRRPGHLVRRKSR
jgi:hypothetical protein